MPWVSSMTSTGGVSVAFAVAGALLRFGAAGGAGGAGRALAALGGLDVLVHDGYSFVPAEGWWVVVGALAGVTGR